VIYLCSVLTGIAYDHMLESHIISKLLADFKRNTLVHVLACLISGLNHMKHLLGYF
jgi:hypothetical protein